MLKKFKAKFTHLQIFLFFFSLVSLKMSHQRLRPAERLKWFYTLYCQNQGKYITDSREIWKFICHMVIYTDFSET